MTYDGTRGKEEEEDPHKEKEDEGYSGHHRISNVHKDLAVINLVANRIAKPFCSQNR